MAKKIHRVPCSSVLSDLIESSTAKALCKRYYGAKLMNVRSSECAKRMGNPPSLFKIKKKRLCRNNPNEEKEIRSDLKELKRKQTS